MAVNLIGKFKQIYRARLNLKARLRIILQKRRRSNRLAELNLTRRGFIKFKPQILACGLKFKQISDR